MMFRLPTEWIFHEPYSTHTWMDAVSIYYSLIPWPWLYLPFLLLVLPTLLAKSEQGMIGFLGLLVVERVLGVTIAGYLLIFGACIWSLSVFHRQPAPRLVKWATGMALLGLAVAILFGFPQVVRFSPTVCRSNLKNVATAIEMYQTDWNGASPSTLASLTPNYLKTLPKCPADSASEESLNWTLEPHQQILICDNPVHKASPAMKVEPLVIPVAEP